MGYGKGVTTMTVPDNGTGYTEEQADDTGFDPIPVSVPGGVHLIRTEATAADFGGYSNETVPLANTGAGYVTLLQRRPTRSKAYVRNIDAANPVIIAETLGKVQATPPQGYILPAGQEKVIENMQPLYAVATVAAVVVSILDEAWSHANTA